jgi:hypothetical protein
LRIDESDYSFCFWRLAEGENINSDWRRAFAREAAKVAGAVEIVRTLNGCFFNMGCFSDFRCDRSGEA